jgi:hypothetical protein
MENLNTTIEQLKNNLLDVIELTFGEDYTEYLDSLNDYDSSEVLVYSYYLEDSQSIQEALNIFAQAIETIKEIKNN